MKKLHPGIQAYLKALKDNNKEKAERILKEFSQVRIWLKKEMQNPNSKFFIE